MKPSLRTIAKPDRSFRPRRKLGGSGARYGEQIANPASVLASALVSPPAPASTSTSASHQRGARPKPADLDLAATDLAAQKVREAGGPIDRASYTCQCGYLFAASVTTTVECPHCGTPQAW